MDDIFGPSGLISKFHKNYEYREGQVEMANKIAAAFAEKRHLIVEAGTGTGKTLAYLIPAIATALKEKKTHHHFNGHEKFAGTIDGEGHSVPAKCFAEKVHGRLHEGTK